MVGFVDFLVRCAHVGGFALMVASLWLRVCGCALVVARLWLRVDGCTFVAARSLHHLLVLCMA